MDISHLDSKAHLNPKAQESTNWKLTWDSTKEKRFAALKNTLFLV